MKGYKLYVDGELLFNGITGREIEEVTGVKVNNNISFYATNPFSHNGNNYIMEKIPDEKADTSWWTEHDTKRWDEIRQAAEIIQNGGHVVTKHKNGKHIHYVEARR